MSNYILTPHIKAEDQGKPNAKANSYAFGPATSNVKKYLTREDLEWLSENVNTVKRVLLDTQDQVRTASERRVEAEAKKTLEKQQKAISALGFNANAGAQFQAMMQQMQALLISQNGQTPSVAK